MSEVFGRGDGEGRGWFWLWGEGIFGRFAAPPIVTDQNKLALKGSNSVLVWNAMLANLPKIPKPRSQNPSPPSPGSWQKLGRVRVSWRS